MRVLFATPLYPTGPAAPGTDFLPSLARALVARGHQVRVATTDPEQASVTDDQGVEVRREPVPSWLGRRPATSFPAPLTMPDVVQLQRALSRSASAAWHDGADVVHAHWCLPSGIAVPSRAPTVLTMHASDVRLMEASRAARVLVKPAIRRAQVLTAVSAHIAARVQELAGRFVPPTCIHAMPVVAPTAQGGGGAGAVALNALTEDARPQLAIEALAILSDLDRPLPLIIEGDGPLRGRAERLARELGVGRLVSFVGPRSPEGQAELLATADLLIDVATNVGFARYGAQALMAGVPVVACWDGAGVVDHIPERGAGRLVLPTPEAVADAVLDILDDPNARERATQRGHEVRHELDADVVASRCLEWYEAALSS